MDTQFFFSRGQRWRAGALACALWWSVITPYFLQMLGRWEGTGTKTLTGVRAVMGAISMYAFFASGGLFFVATWWLLINGAKPPRLRQLRRIDQVAYYSVFFSYAGVALWWCVLLLSRMRLSSNE